MNQKLIFVGLFILAVSQPILAVDSAYLNSAIDINYGVVESVHKTKVDSKAGQGAVLGGLLGALTSGGHHHRGKHALTGAVAGGVLSAMLQGNRKAYSYLIQTVDGQQIKVITEQSGIRTGDCVAIEQGKMTNVRRVATVHCEHYQHPVMHEPMVHAKVTEDAAECHTAKEMALKASTDDEINIAMKKVKIFCN